MFVTVLSKTLSISSITSMEGNVSQQLYFIVLVAFSVHVWMEVKDAVLKDVCGQCACQVAGPCLKLF